ncbi:lytic transglycosylase domain-containing protein [Caballeronia sp. LZ035]|uniref:lytic transglycosylase domain-containing protein n=1 Tax=Caballeronia sp. LZ035 TaxID=3038568 RepID=UPI00285754CF|nr:lytic transglycosylase domain-containing protein [Caballeronia sp. LZ035]MDR5757647.1 lytic transglycosylase domain-containing protein [Caballeronia sp. LZ035]
MANSNLDQFTINYQIKVNAAVTELSKLNAKTAETNKGLNAITGGAKDFASTTVRELGKVAPAFDNIASSLRGITTGFGGASLAVGGFTAALYAAYKTAMLTRDQINAQRQDARASGMGMLRFEDWSHRLVGGNVTRGNVSDSLKSLRGVLNNAYADRSRTGPENRLLAMLGVQQGASPLSTTAAGTQLAARWKGMQPSQIQAEAQMLGMNKDVALSMAKQGGALGTINMSADQLKARQDAIANTAKFNDELAKFNEEMTKLTTTVGGFVLGPLADFVSGLNKSLNYAKTDHGQPEVGMGTIPVADGDWTGGKGLSEALKSTEKVTQDVNETARWSREAAKESTEKTKQEQKNVEAAAVADDEDNAQFQAIVSQFQLAINSFTDSVNIMSGVTDEHAAWSAWAGEVGRASGIGTGANPSSGMPGDNRPGGFTYNPVAAGAALTGGASGSAGSNAYDAQISAAAKKYGMPESLVRGIIGTESTWNPNAHSDSSFGLMGVNKVNWAKYGLNDKNWNDPAANIDAGTAILAAMMKKAGGDQTLGLRYYHGGFDRSKWGPVNAAYPAKVLANGGAYFGMSGPQANAWDRNATPAYGFTGGPQTNLHQLNSKDGIQIVGLAKQVAADLGLRDYRQVMTGGVPKADIAWALSNRLSSLLQAHAGLEQRAQLPIANPAARAQLVKDTADNEHAMSNLHTWGSTVEGFGGPGGRTFSQGVTQNNTFNINGATDPEHVGRVVEQHLNRQNNGVANSGQSGRLQ